jgi:hypothetical protein
VRRSGRPYLDDQTRDYRLRRPGEEGDELDELIEDIRSISWWRFAVLVPVVFLVWRFWHHSSAPGSQIRCFTCFFSWSPRMVWRVWRVTSRRSVSEVVEEIAAALERGDPRPAPAAATWIGYDEGTR